MLRTAILICAMFGVAIGDASAQTSYFRDSSGRIVGSSTRVGNGTVYRSANGRTVGTSARYGRSVIYRTPNGRTVGSQTFSR